MKPHIKMNPSLKKLLFWGVVLEAVIILVSYVVHQDYTETFRHAARYSGRLSAVVFLCTFYNYAKSFPSPLKTNLQLRNLLTLFCCSTPDSFRFFGYEHVSECLTRSAC